MSYVLMLMLAFMSDSVPICVEYVSAASEQGFEDKVVLEYNENFRKTNTKRLKENNKKISKNKFDEVKSVFHIENCETNVIAYIVKREEEEVSRQKSYIGIEYINKVEFVTVEIRINEISIPLDKVSKFNVQNNVLTWLVDNEVSIRKSLDNYK